MFSFAGLYETGSEMPPSLARLIAMLLLFGKVEGRAVGIEDDDDNALVIGIEKLVALWFVSDGKEEEEEKGAAVV